MSAEGPCASFAPGRALPAGECENCHYQRGDHHPDHQSRPTAGTMAQYSGAPTMSTRAERPPVVYCRQCSAGIRIGEGIDAESYPCPRCRMPGPKSNFPAQQEKLPKQPNPGVVAALAALDAQNAEPVSSESLIVEIGEITDANRQSGRLPSQPTPDEEPPKGRSRASRKKRPSEDSGV